MPPEIGEYYLRSLFISSVGEAEGARPIEKRVICVSVRGRRDGGSPFCEEPPWDESVDTPYDRLRR